MDFGTTARSAPELKRNVKELWWNTMTRQRDDIAGLEATIIMHRRFGSVGTCGYVQRPDD